MTANRTAYFSPPTEGQLVKAFGDNLIRVSTEKTEGALSVMEVTLTRGAGTPLHVHEREDETFRVLRGRVGFWCGDVYGILEKDGLAFLPRGIPHRIENVGEVEASVMVVLTPGGFEKFFADIAKSPTVSPEDIAARYGLRFL